MSTKIRNGVSALLASLMLVGMLAFAIPASAAQTITVNKGDSTTVKLDINQYLTGATVQDSSIATISASGTNVTVTGLKEGTTTATAYYTTNTGQQGEILTITVSDVTSKQPTQNINLALPSQPSYTATLTGTSSSLVSNSDSTVASTELTGTSTQTLIIRALKAGTTTIVVNAKSGSTTTQYTYYVTVTGTSTAATTTDATVSLAAGESKVVAPKGTQDLTVSSGNTTNIAKLEKNSSNQLVVTGVAAGTVNLSYTYSQWVGANKNTYTVSIPVTVTGTGSNTSATESVEIKVGETKTVMSNMTSIGLTNTGTASVALPSIENGAKDLSIKGVAAGTSTITVTYNNGGVSGTKTFNVRVVADTSAATPTNSRTTGLYFTKNAASIKKGKTYQYSSIYLEGAKTAPSKLLWVSSNTSVVTVNSKTGKFKGVKAGKARIIAVDKQGKYVNYLDITVK